MFPPEKNEEKEEGTNFQYDPEVPEIMTLEGVMKRWVVPTEEVEVRKRIRLLPLSKENISLSSFDEGNEKKIEVDKEDQGKRKSYWWTACFVFFVSCFLISVVVNAIFIFRK